MVRGLGKRVVWRHFPEQAGSVDLRKVSDAAFELTERYLRSLKCLVVRR